MYGGGWPEGMPFVELEGPSPRERLSLKTRISTKSFEAIQMGSHTNSSAACPVNIAFCGDALPAMAEEPFSGDADLTCTVLEFFLSV